MKRLFTVVEANALLPILKREIEALQSIQRSFSEKYKQMKQLQKKGAEDEEALFSLECEMDFLQIEARTHIGNFERHGVQLKDVEAGLLDFPAELDGEKVLLCWKMGEASVAHYHSWDGGFQGRKPLQDNET